MQTEIAAAWFWTLGGASVSVPGDGRMKPNAPPGWPASIVSCCWLVATPDGVGAIHRFVVLALRISKRDSGGGNSLVKIALLAAIGVISRGIFCAGNCVLCTIDGSFLITHEVTFLLVYELPAGNS